MEERLARLQREEEEKRSDARERARLHAAKRVLAQRAMRAGRYGAHEESMLGGTAGVDRRLKMHCGNVTDGKLEDFEREEVTREAEVEAEEKEKEKQMASPAPPPLPSPPQGAKTKKKTKGAATTARPAKARATWMSAVETRWPQHDVATAAGERERQNGSRHRRHSPSHSPSPTPAELRKRRVEYVTPPPPPSLFTASSERRRGRPPGGGEHPSPAPPPDPATPTSLSAIEAHRVRELVAHSLHQSSCGPGPNSTVVSGMMPPFTLASLRLLEVAHPSLRAKHAALQRVTPGALLRQWGAYLAVCDDTHLPAEKPAKENVFDAEADGSEEATRRRLARRMGGMLISFGAWAAASAASASGGAGVPSTTEAEAVEEGTCKLLANRVLADLSRDAEKHGAWMKSAVSEWRVYRASWFAGSSATRW